MSDEEPWFRVIRERDELRAENAKLNAWMAEFTKSFDKQTAEIERLRAKLDETDRQLTAIEHLNAREKIELRAEIERLRAEIERLGACVDNERLRASAYQLHETDQRLKDRR